MNTSEQHICLEFVFKARYQFCEVSMSSDSQECFFLKPCWAQPCVLTHKTRRVLDGGLSESLHIYCEYE